MTHFLQFLTLTYLFFKGFFNQRYEKTVKVRVLLLLPAVDILRR